MKCVKKDGAYICNRYYMVQVVNPAHEILFAADISVTVANIFAE